MDDLHPDLQKQLLGPCPSVINGDDVAYEGCAGAWAAFSSDRTYRYLLGRLWDPLRPLLVVGMLNPSKADANQEDPTVRRVIGFARRDHFGGVWVWNSCALVATDPADLLRHPDPVGPRNLEAIRAACRGPSDSKTVVVVAWGKPGKQRIISHTARAEHVAHSERGRLYRWGETTKDGHPRHPLYLRGNTLLVRHR